MLPKVLFHFETAPSFFRIPIALSPFSVYDIKKKGREYMRCIQTSGLAGKLIHYVIRNPGIIKKIASAEVFHPEPPRSVSGCDRLLLPVIVKDFPDFDVTTAKETVKQALREKYGSQPGYTLHKVVISEYLRTAQKTVVFQAAFATKDAMTVRQRRVILHYTYLMPKSDQTLAANCPNCGGALGYGEVECSFCGSRVANPLGSSWQFTEIRED